MIDEEVTLVTAHGLPPIVTLVCALTKFDPEMVNVRPATPDVGLIDVIVGVDPEL